MSAHVMNYTRPSTTLTRRRPGNEARVCPYVYVYSLASHVPSLFSHTLTLPIVWLFVLQYQAGTAMYKEVKTDVKIGQSG